MVSAQSTFTPSHLADPLAMKIRWKLKKHGIAAEEIMSVFSVEKPVCELLPLDEEQRQAPQVTNNFKCLTFKCKMYCRLNLAALLSTIGF